MATVPLSMGMSPPWDPYDKSLFTLLPNFLCLFNIDFLKMSETSKTQDLYFKWIKQMQNLQKCFL